MNKLVFHLLCFSLIWICSCNEPEKKKEVAYFDTSGMDTTVKPGDNFFMYANQKWIKGNKIPDDQSGWGSFYTLFQENLIKLKTIVEESSLKKGSKGSAEQKVGDYYISGMDTLTIEKVGYQPLKPMLARIDSIKNHAELMDLVAELYTIGKGSLIGFDVYADEKNSKKNIAVFSQAGLTFPEKGYYSRTDSATAMERRKLEELATTLFILTGADSMKAKRDAADLLKLETEISKSHLLQEELRDPIKNYNKMSLIDLEKISPNIGWNKIFDKWNVKPDSVNVSQPAYYKALNSLLVSQPIEVWKTKLKFNYIRLNIASLSTAFRDAKFKFDQIFTGQKVQQQRWKTIVNMTDDGLQDVLGKLYIEKYYPPKAKQRMDELVSNLQKAFENRIKKLEWMSDSTRQRALVKLNTFMKKIGYTEKWKNFDDVEISGDNFFANNMSIGKHQFNETIRKVGKPVDRTEWGMTPSTVNAYYNPTFNEIVFPAGILQPPFFNMDADDAINYGSIGMVIGHEMTHGFDDQGRQYDQEGNLNDWWTASDAEKFNQRSGIVTTQYNGYTVLDTMHINGKLTLGENLADIGGLAIAYDAFKLTKQGKGDEKIDGFTPDQRFFLGFAQVWRLINRDETMRMRVKVDPHSPEIYRVNGPLSNFAPFYKAFNVQEDNKMYKKEEDRARVW